MSSNRRLSQDESNRLLIKTIKINSLDGFNRAMNEGADPNHLYLDFGSLKTPLMLVFNYGDNSHSFAMAKRLIAAGAMVSDELNKRAEDFIDSTFIPHRNMAIMLRNEYIKQRNLAAVHVALGELHVPNIAINKSTRSI